MSGLPAHCCRDLNVQRRTEQGPCRARRCFLSPSSQVLLLQYPNADPDRLIGERPSQVTVAAPTAPTRCFSWSLQIPPCGEQTRPLPAHSLCSHPTACPQRRKANAAVCGSAVPPGDGQSLRSGSFHTCHTPSCNIPDGTAKLSPITTRCRSPLLLLHPHKPTERNSLSAGIYPLHFRFSALIQAQISH